MANFFKDELELTGWIQSKNSGEEAANIIIKTIEELNQNTN